MENYICTVCHYVYEPAENNNIAFEDLPDDYVCPLCGVGKDLFETTINDLDMNKDMIDIYIQQFGL